MGNKHYYIDTTITDIYMLNEGVVGISCNPNPDTLNVIYKNSPFHKKSNHKQNSDLFLHVSDPNYTNLMQDLKVGNTYSIKYNHVLSKNFDDELDYKKESIKFNELYYNHKIKQLNNKKRMYTNYISFIRCEPIYKMDLDVFDVKESPFKEYYELDTYDLTKERFLIEIEMSDIITKRGDDEYQISYKKSNLGENFYMVLNIIKYVGLSKWEKIQ